MEHLSSVMEQQNQEHHQQQQVEWRRHKVQELCSKGYSQREISQVLQVGLATVNRDISYLRNEAKTNIKKYIDERLPFIGLHIELSVHSNPDNTYFYLCLLENQGHLKDCRVNYFGFGIISLVYLRKMEKISL